VRFFQELKNGVGGVSRRDTVKKPGCCVSREIWRWALYLRTGRGEIVPRGCTTHGPFNSRFPSHKRANTGFCSLLNGGAPKLKPKVAQKELAEKPRWKRGGIRGPPKGGKSLFAPLNRMNTHRPFNRNPGNPGLKG